MSPGARPAAVTFAPPTRESGAAGADEPSPTFFLAPDWRWEKRRQQSGPALAALRRLVLPQVRRGAWRATAGAGRARERVTTYAGGRQPLALEPALERAWPGRPETLVDPPVLERLERGPGLVVMLDTSLSMAGPARVAAAVAAAALARLAGPGRLGLVGFGETARVVIAPGRWVRPLEAAYRVLALPMGGVTDLAAGLKLGLGLVRAVGRDVQAVLVSDGERTAGADPRALAGAFGRLHVVLVGGRNLALGRELARRGGGRLRVVEGLAGLAPALARLVAELERAS